MGLEPTTSSLGSWHSTTELLPLLGVLLHPFRLRSASRFHLYKSIYRIPHPGGWDYSPVETA
jgi:hypothetical protein